MTKISTPGITKNQGKSRKLGKPGGHGLVVAEIPLHLIPSRLDMVASMAGHWRSNDAKLG